VQRPQKGPRLSPTVPPPGPAPRPRGAAACLTIPRGGGQAAVPRRAAAERKALQPPVPARHLPPPRLPRSTRPMRLCLILTAVERHGAIVYRFTLLVRFARPERLAIPHLTTPAIAGAAAAEGSPASARPRPPPTRRRGRPPDDPARQSAVAEPRRKALQPPVHHLPAPPRPRPPEACRPSPWLHGAVIPLVPACRLRKPPSSIATPRRVVALCRSHGAVRNGVVNQLAKNICRLTQP
jgi:hypothetical protein